MKLLFVSDYYPPHHKGGAEVSTALLAESLAPEDTSVVMCNNRRHTPWTHNGIPVKPVLSITDVGDRGPLAAVKYAAGICLFPALNVLRLAKANRNIRPAIIQIVPSSYQFIPLALAALVFMKKAVVIDCRDYSLICPANLPHDYLQPYKHGYTCLNRYQPANKLLGSLSKPFALYETAAFALTKSLLKLAIRRSDRIRLVAISDYVRRALITDGYPQERLTDIPNISPAASHTSKAPRSHFTFAGRLETSKGVWDVIEAAEILRSQGAEPDILFIGEGAESARLQDYASAHHLTNIRFIGKASPAKVQEYYTTSYAVLAPSRWPEPFGRFIQEATAAGTAVIATRVGGIPEAVTDSINGLLVAPESPGELAAAMLELYRNTARRDQLAAGIRKLAPRFAAAAIARRRRQLYRSLIA